jgi:hypothetical protein
MPPCACRGLLAVFLLLGSALPARADLTIFAGLQSAPTLRPTTGISLGFGLLIVGWEVEIARTSERRDELAPSITTGTGSVYVQNPVPISGVQLYALAGAGLYRERLDVAYQQTDVHVALGGGAKIALAGPLKLRLDYRFFKLRGALEPNPQRLYAGLALAF